ncbi:tetratricopeptide repeat protein [Zobellia laminariae]|uniref:tetratricopeptide repeat protein n=1 Tax=Zobellia laminariae TaxID=248906 RepID=UPI003EFB272A
MKYVVFIFVLFASCKGTGESQIVKEQTPLTTQDSLKIETYVAKANKSRLDPQNYQKYLDSVLLIKPDSAYFWQQKAMPLYKARKYSVGKPFLKKAADLYPEKYLSYSAFMKCLFSKEYEESIEEFMDMKERFGDSYVMDHTYNFYIALDYLQLNRFDEAKAFLLKSKEQQFADFPDDPPYEACHYMDWFYLGIAEMELKNYEEGIKMFDTSLQVYTNFADAIYYKAVCMKWLGKMDDAKILLEEAIKNKENTINEDQVFYEIYPYQTFHRLSSSSRQQPQNK